MHVTGENPAGIRPARRGRAWIAGLMIVALTAGCAATRKRSTPKIQPDPYTLKSERGTRLRSRVLDISIRYREGGPTRAPFVVLRLTNRTRAPIYPLLERIYLLRAGAEPLRLVPDCEREHYHHSRLAPREALWCASTANPGYSVDLPLALTDIPAEREVVRFDLEVPIIFDEGPPVEVRFGNRVELEKWELTLAAEPPAESAAAAAGDAGPAHP